MNKLHRKDKLKHKNNDNSFAKTIVIEGKTVSVVSKVPSSRSILMSSLERLITARGIEIIANITPNLLNSF